jgi:hypothetical protein
MLLLVAFCGSVFAQTKAAPPSPVIVAKVALTGLTGAISPTTIYTFKKSLYRVSSYWEIVVPGPADCNSSIFLYVQWTDDTPISQQKTVGATDCFDYGSAGTTYVVHGAAGTPLTYSVTTNPEVPGMVYNWYITVEQLE